MVEFKKLLNGKTMMVSVALLEKVRIIHSMKMKPLYALVKAITFKKQTTAYISRLNLVQF